MRGNGVSVQFQRWVPSPVTPRNTPKGLQFCAILPTDDKSELAAGETEELGLDGGWAVTAIPLPKPAPQERLLSMLPGLSYECLVEEKTAGDHSPSCVYGILLWVHIRLQKFFTVFKLSRPTGWYGLGWCPIWMLRFHFFLKVPGFDHVSG